METNTQCDCAIEISQQFARWQARQGGGEVYQSSLMSALLAGVYEGETTMADLLRHGDFGLGTFNRLDGELIAFERQIHQLKADGSARIEQIIYVERESQRPIVLGKGGQTLKWIGQKSREELTELLDRPVHLFITVKVDPKWQDSRALYAQFGLDFDV